MALLYRFSRVSFSWEWQLPLVISQTNLEIPLYCHINCLAIIQQFWNISINYFIVPHFCLVFLIGISCMCIVDLNQPTQIVYFDLFILYFWCFLSTKIHYLFLSSGLYNLSISPLNKFYICYFLVIDFSFLIYFNFIVLRSL